MSVKRDVVWSSQFKKDYKLALKQKRNLELLDECIRALAKGATLPKKYRDHSLSGNWKGYRECHIESDWLLIYRIEGNDLILVLARTGTHSELLE